MIVVATHHKTGTVLLGRIFRELSNLMGWSFFSGRQKDLPENTDLFFQDHSQIDMKILPEGSRGVHIIRHPMEVIASSYRYHLKTDEYWATGIDRERFGGTTHQKYLQQLSHSEGVTFEMVETGYRTIHEMYNWDYTDTRFLNIHLEDFMEDFKTSTARMLEFLGFKKAEVQRFATLFKKYDKKIWILSISPTIRIPCIRTNHFWSHIIIHYFNYCFQMISLGNLVTQKSPWNTLNTSRGS